MRTVSIPAGRPALARSRRLLARAGDERLVQAVREGSEAAFEVVYERYERPILSFCRHMLGSREEAEDAVQQTFASAYRDLLRDERDINLKPWLYTIARNRCLSMLRAAREEPAEIAEQATAGLDEQVERRADLKDLLHDLRDLPHDQRAALLLSETGDLSHAEVAGVLGCEVHKVKALVFRARSGLIERREARETPCEEIREQLSVLSGGSLRRSEIKHHLKTCEGCRAFREDVKRQRQMLGLVLPVAPSAGLKASVLGALGIGGGAAGGGGAAAGGLGLAAGGGFGSATVAKVAAVAVLAGGGAVAGTVAVKDGGDRAVADKPPASQGPREARAEGSAPAVRERVSAKAPAPAKRRNGPAKEKASKVNAGGGAEKGSGEAARESSPGRPAQPGAQGQGLANRSPKAQGTPSHGTGKPESPGRSGDPKPGNGNAGSGPKPGNGPKASPQLPPQAQGTPGPPAQPPGKARGLAKQSE